MTLLIGPRNCESETGLPWRHVRDHYRPLAVEIGRKLAIPADALLAAIKTTPTHQGDDPVSTEDAAETVRRALGKRRR